MTFYCVRGVPGERHYSSKFLDGDVDRPCRKEVQHTKPASMDYSLHMTDDGEARVIRKKPPEH